MGPRSLLNSKGNGAYRDYFMLLYAREVLLAARKIAPMRWALVFLFMLLTVWELADGQTAVTDVISPLLLILLMHGVFTQSIHRQLSSPDREGGVKAFFRHVKEGIKEACLADSNHLTRSEKATKILMNNFFIIMFLLAVVMEVVNTQKVGQVQAYAFVVWSAVFLASNVRDFLKTLSLPRLLVTNIALFMMLGSFALL